MPEISVSVDDAVARELGKRDRKIATLEGKLAKLESEKQDALDRLTALQNVRNVIVEAAYTLDSYFGDDR